MKFLIQILILLIIFPVCLKAGSKESIYVASISWHTGIIIPANSMPDSLWPGPFDFSAYEYLEIGWGDRDFFQHPAFNLWYALKAVLWPTSSALHVLPVNERHLPERYKDTRLLRLTISDNELNNLVLFLLNQFERNSEGQVIPLGEGFYQNSHFFAGRTKYYFPKNSNVWAAMALKRAGFRYNPVFYQTTGMVLNRAEAYGEIIHSKN